MLHVIICRHSRDGDNNSWVNVGSVRRCISCGCLKWLTKLIALTSQTPSASWMTLCKVSGISTAGSGSRHSPELCPLGLPLPVFINAGAQLIYPYFKNRFWRPRKSTRRSGEQNVWINCSCRFYDLTSDVAYFFDGGHFAVGEIKSSFSNEARQQKRQVKEICAHFKISNKIHSRILLQTFEFIDFAFSICAGIYRAVE